MPSLSRNGQLNEQPHRSGHSVRGLANWILDYADRQGARHTNMGINKLTFFAVEAFLQKKNILITNAKIEAWEHGPVFRELYQSFKPYGNGYVLGRARRYCAQTNEFQEASATLSHEDESLLEAVVAPLIFCTAAELRALSHKLGSAWHHVWWYKGYANPGMEITPGIIIQVQQGGEVEEG